MKNKFKIIICISLTLIFSLSLNVKGILHKYTVVEAEENKKIIAIDPGHQKNGNPKKEPIGPGSKKMKPKVSSGTTGVKTRKPEYVLNLEVAKKLRKKLEDNGYKVIMIRETHDVNLSNKERADIANEANADLFLRLHADGIDNSSVNGISTLCPSSKNPYVANLSEKSKKISKLLVDEMSKATKAKNRSVIERDDMSGINWSKVSVSIVEMGFMSNPKEDVLLSDDKYQDKLVDGMFNAITRYFNE